ncbi:hypothetical protein DAMA08_023340 [Martiniozyma asiatica (nom. inval.)]|nr:hypothetical protein DAMA08_023340 [Martiniozyma asiatica]
MDAVELFTRDDNSLYDGYSLSFAVNLVVAIIFGIFLVTHVFLARRARQWLCLYLWGIGLSLEFIGYIGRVINSKNMDNLNAFIMQAVCITIGPCYLMGGIYFLIGQLTIVHGQKYSALRPVQYAVVFIILDFIAVGLQSTGGAILSSATTLSTENLGIHITLGGLAFQLLSTLIFQGYWYVFLYKIYQANKLEGDSAFPKKYESIRKSKTYKPFLYAISLSVVLIFIRSCYRVAELAKDDGKLSYDEIYPMILDALMIILASLCLLLVHPGIIFRKVDAKIKISLIECFRPREVDDIEMQFVDADNLSAKQLRQTL